MLHSLRLSLGNFPFKDLPNTAEEYYEREGHCFRRKRIEVLNSRETLINALESDEDFSNFWERYRETRPDSNKEYLSSLLDPTKPFKNAKITAEYDAYLRRQKLSDISAAAREKIQSEFDEIRPTLYQIFLEVEAFRLNCDVSEVRPRVPVLPLEEDRGQSQMCSLPNDIFAKIMARLETIEIFQMTHVCKQWRHLVYQNASVLTRAEHSLPTHLLTFTNWMDPSNVVKGRDFRMRYKSLSPALMRWCINVSQNLETLVLPELYCPSVDVMPLVRQCPNLKHLHFKWIGPGGEIGTNLQLPKLETLITDRSVFEFISDIVVDVFATSHNLRVFKGKLDTRDIISIDEKRLNQDAFSNLIALQLTSISYELLGFLARIDQLRLRYLHLGDSFALTECRVHLCEGMIDRKRDAFHSLLSKLNQLEVLVSLWELDLDASTIKLMIKRNQRLKSAMIWFNVTTPRNEEVAESIIGRDLCDDHVALVSFEEMLLERDPSIDLSGFGFIVEDERSKSLLQDAETGFSIYEESDLHLGFFDQWDLSNLAMRKRLGIDF